MPGGPAISARKQGSARSGCAIPDAAAAPGRRETVRVIHKIINRELIKL
jgi:hypothetical protein